MKICGNMKQFAYLTNQLKIFYIFLSFSLTRNSFPSVCELAAPSADERREEFNFLESKYEHTKHLGRLFLGRGHGWSRRPDVHVARPRLLSRGQAYRTRVNMHVCVCIARRLLLPVSLLRSMYRAHFAKANFAVLGKLDG